LKCDRDLVLYDVVDDIVEQAMPGLQRIDEAGNGTRKRHLHELVDKAIMLDSATFLDRLGELRVSILPAVKPELCAELLMA
jgi:hypothetical protein